MINAIIVDDVKQARETLKKDLANYCPEVNVIDEASGVVDGAKKLRNANVDVAFLDIQMNDGSGFDLLEIIEDIKFKIIFTTASDSYAIKAFKFSAVDYLLKPIDPDELIAAVKKLDGQRIESQENLDLLKDHIKGSAKPVQKLALNTMDKIHITNISDIVRCESNANYTMFYFSSGKKLLVTKTLKEFESLLKDHSFIRVHQSHLINSNYLKEYVKTDGGYLVMTDSTQVPVSTRKKQQVLEIIESL